MSIIIDRVESFPVAPRQGLIDEDTRDAILADWRQIESRRVAEYGNFTRISGAITTSPCD